ncbi:hypothetical protein LC613_08530 [Nostoc sphaeroides CHAB 2801]|uniref:hypothetical protein n=1 Tax=Nostoc sphaeroides TaxID=446679 RepID=UPI000E52AB7F|nr:hypothetical protein [Nostoc sphaeroides]MCC5628163.1 hypothetical protein [Nostoc sphaeroides CHAB 2801]
MIRRIALISSLAVLSAVAFTPKAQAQNADVDFTGTVPATCTINSTTNGTLALVNARNLLADATNGTPANLNVSCNAGTTFTITSVANNGTALSGSATYAANIAGVFTSVRDGATTVANGNVSPNGLASIAGNPPGVAGALQVGPITNKNYAVDMSVFNIGSTALPIGNYNVRVNVALTPQ